MRRITFSVPGLALLAGIIINVSDAAELTQQSLDETLYHAYQGKWFEALERLNTELHRGDARVDGERDLLWYQALDENFSVGDLELRYRMDRRALRILLASLDEAPDETIHNRDAYRLARLHFRKGRMQDALRALDQISGEIPDEIRDDVAFLRASIYLNLEWSDPAIPVLEKLLKSKEYSAFAAYNLGIAFLQGDLRRAAHEQLDRAGRIKPKNDADAAIRDKANLVLGTLLLKEEQHKRALTFLNRVRLDGPFSNRALLSAGWANMSTAQTDKAIVSWNVLAERDATDRAVQEAMLAMPYAYSQLGLHSQAAGYYSRALNAYSREFERLSQSIASIQEGRFLAALLKDDIQEDEDWVIRLRSLPDAPETYYLLELLASNSFQFGLTNLLELADLKRKLLRRSADLAAYGQLIAIRKRHYESLLPEIDRQLGELGLRLTQRSAEFEMLREQRHDIASSSQPQEIQKTRLAALDRKLDTLEEALDLARRQYDQSLAARQMASDSYTGYGETLDKLSEKIELAIDTIDGLMSRQGQLLEKQAIDELTARLRRLDNYANKARFGLADSKDRVSLETQE